MNQTPQIPTAMTGRNMTAEESRKNPLLKKLKGFSDFKPDQGSIDGALAVDEEAVLTALRRKLGIK